MAEYYYKRGKVYYNLGYTVHIFHVVQDYVLCLSVPDVHALQTLFLLA